MRIELSLSDLEADHPDLRDKIHSRIWFSLGRFSTIIESVSVHLNRSGDFKTSICEITLQVLRPNQKISTEAVAGEPLEAAIACIERCQRTIERRLSFSSTN